MKAWHSELKSHDEKRPVVSDVKPGLGTGSGGGKSKNPADKERKEGDVQREAKSRVAENTRYRMQACRAVLGQPWPLPYLHTDS